MKTEQALVQVHKYNRARDEYPYYLSFYVDVGDGTTLQSIIEYIYEHHDQTLAYRNSRCNQGICGNCVVNVNGNPVKACSTIIRNGDVVKLEPVNIKKQIRDLATTL